MQRSRIRFRFSLRLLFVIITAASIWMAWQVKMVRDRKAILNRFSADDHVIVVFEGGVQGTIRTVREESARPVPFFRRLLGDRDVAQIHFWARELTEADDRAIRYFPEALITGDPPVPDWSDEY